MSDSGSVPLQATAGVNSRAGSLVAGCGSWGLGVAARARGTSRGSAPGADAGGARAARHGQRRAGSTRWAKDDEHTEPKDCRHYAAAVRFVHTDAGWAAGINPTYRFTFDGYRDLPWGEDRIKGMKRIEKNLAVRGLMQFWAEYLARPSELGGQRSGTPVRRCGCSLRAHQGGMV